MMSLSEPEFVMIRLLKRHSQLSYCFGYKSRQPETITGTRASFPKRRPQMFGTTVKVYRICGGSLKSCKAKLARALGPTQNVDSDIQRQSTPASWAAGTMSDPPRSTHNFKENSSRLRFFKRWVA